MEPADTWTIQDMLKVAEELRVPLSDHRGGFLRLVELRAGQLVYDPKSGRMPKTS
jgi:hypothetical protein